MRRTWGLQQRVMLLLLAAIVPLSALSVWLAWREARASSELAQSQLRFAASLVATNQNAAIDAAMHLLGAISILPEMRQPDRTRCEAYFERLRSLYPVYSNMGLLDLNGRAVCHARHAMGELNAADRTYFREALAQRRFVMGEAVIGRPAGRWTLPFAMPVLDEGRVAGVVFASLDLKEASRNLASLPLPEGARVMVADRHQRVLIDHPARPDLPVPHTLEHTAMVEAARTMEAGVGESVEGPGEIHLVAFAPSRLVGSEGFVVRVGLDREQILGSTTGRLRDALLGLAFTLTASLAAAWWIGRQGILRPARKILAAVHRLQRGKLSERIVLDAELDGEFSRIAGAFNLMADSLQARQRDLETELARGRAAYEILEQVVNSIPDGLIAISTSGEVLMQNAAAASVIPLDPEPPPAGQWPRVYGLHHADGKTLYDTADLPLVRAARGESGHGQEMLVRNQLVPEGRLLDVAFRPMRAGGELTGGLAVLADITQRRKNEAELLLLRKAVARLNDIVMITEAGPLASPGPRIVFVNEAFERLTGYGVQEALGRTPEILQGPGTDQAALERMRKALLRGVAVREELTQYAKDGREMVLEIDIVPLASDSGSYTHLISVQRDITARKQTERALLDSDQELKMFSRVLQRTAEAAKRITGQQTLRGTLQEVASQAREVIGCHVAQVSVTTEADWDQAVTALSLSRRNKSMAQPRALPAAADVHALASGNGHLLRLTHGQMLDHPLLRGFAGRHDGTPPVRGLLAVTLVDRGGDKIGLLQVLDKEEGEFTERDDYVLQELAHLATTAIENARLFQQIRGFNASLESRIAERTAELARHEARFRALTDQAPVIVWNVDASGRVTYLNRAWMEMVGGGMEDWLGHKWMQRTHPEDVEQMKANWQRSRETLQAYVGTRRILAKDGAWHTTFYRAAPVTDEHGGIAFWVGIDNDITELKAIEQALRNSNEELQAFSYSVSHDLRAPLGAIGGFARALEHRVDAGADERTRHFLTRIHAGVAKMEQLIDAMLSLAKVARAPLAFEPVDLSELARDAVEGLRIGAPERQVAVHVQDGLVALGDARLLRVVLDNLVGNAWKFTSRREHGEIEVGTKGAGVFYVRDNGAGFDMAYADKLFGAFQRLHTESEFPGTGIGLATVRRVIARHQGQVWCHSVTGEGTTFFFSLSASAPPAWLAGSGG